MAEIVAVIPLHLLRVYLEIGGAQLIHMGAGRDPLMIHDLEEKGQMKTVTKERAPVQLMMREEAL